MEIKTHMTKESDLALRKTTPQDQGGQTFKPKGLWYAIGDAWLDWCGSEMPDWVAPYIYTFEILVDNNILFLNTIELVQEFTKQYRVELFKGYYNIDWGQVTKHYDGVEFNPYFNGIRFNPNLMWYSGIDVPSGVIFNTDIVTNLRLIAKEHIYT